MKTSSAVRDQQTEGLMPEIMRSKSQAVLADLHKLAPPENLPSHYDLLLIT
jgi:hypothetical protein